MVATALVATTSGYLAVFLVGGLAVQISGDLGFGVARLGVMATVFFAASAAASVPAGWLAEHLGTRRAILTAAALSALSLAGVAVLGRSWGALVAYLAVAGISNGISQPAVNLLLARGIAARRQGLAFGVKQGAVPAASLLGGMAVPVLGLTVGWQWAFGLAVALPASLVLLAPDVGAPAKRDPGSKLRTGDAPARALAALAMAAGLGTAAASMLGTFLVTAAVARGVAESPAGVLLAAGSAFGVAGRVFFGWRADLGDTRYLVPVGRLMLAGAVGFAFLAVAPSLPWMVLGTALAFGAGWGWNGVLTFAVVRTNPRAPAYATGVTQAGLYLGGMSGPVLFALVSERWSFAAGWAVGSVLLLAAWVAVVVGARLMKGRTAPSAA